MFHYPERNGLQRRLAYGNYVRRRVFPHLQDVNLLVQGRGLQSQNQRRSILSTSSYNQGGVSLYSLYKNSRVYCKENVECSICFEKDDVIIRELKCGHSFHMCCIDKWFFKKKSCPYCRRILF
jgi:hypothetical protein